ncbi:phage protein NinX family protein [Pantoea agglomerans]|uniref:phage protein NinX family protein n=1 Tax=Enterobacter agglomerans TaxID=549 RepID=UPI00177F3400|nr:phage protein NinX family protein [Pantoea agglomerans]MBD8155013.1 DUF2591 family protein [Pantoea agglomerans]
MNYSQMSDVDIAVLVGRHVSKDGQSLVGINGRACIHEYAPSIGNFGEMCLGWKEFDPCNSWTDAGPIIMGNKITILHDEQLGWCAGVAYWVDGYEFGFSKCEYAHPNPLRAAMIAFLMMQEQPNA